MWNSPPFAIFFTPSLSVFLTLLDSPCPIIISGSQPYIVGDVNVCPSFKHLLNKHIFTLQCCDVYRSVAIVILLINVCSLLLQDLNNIFHFLFLFFFNQGMKQRQRALNRRSVILRLEFICLTPPIRLQRLQRIQGNFNTTYRAQLNSSLVTTVTSDLPRKSSLLHLSSSKISLLLSDSFRESRGISTRPTKYS